MSESLSTLIIHVVVMLAAGILGGIINYYLSQESADGKIRFSRNTLLKCVVISIGASLMVPLFLEIISSDLIKLDKLDSSKILVFFGFCLIAAISSRKFIVTLSEKVLKEAKEAKDKALEVESKIEKREEQTILDARALALLEKALEENPDPEEASVSSKELKDIILKASTNVKITAFMKARSFRRHSTDTNTLTKETADRLIAIFDALIEGDKENKYHRNHAQLAYTLIDKPEKEPAGALQEISKAIEIRDRLAIRGFQAYEFVRAICRIEGDSDFQNGKPSSQENVELIKNDLLKIAGHSYWGKVITGEIKKDRNASLHSWKKLNKLEL